MPTLYAITVTIHILAACLWIGGMGLFAIVVVPVAKRTLDGPAARGMLRAVGTRFATVGWWALGTLIVTGIANLGFRGVLPLLGTASFWSSPFGTTLAAKLAAVTLVLVVSRVHALDARQPQARAARASSLGRATLGLSVVVVVLAVFLVRGSPF